jgi:predicted CXXCH cytochrome family protein
MNCHALDQPDVKWNPQDKSITLGWGQTLTLEQYQAVPKIGMDKRNSGHPMMGHPFMGVRDPSVKSTEKNKVAEMGCLSCHQPHTSAASKLMPKDVKDSSALCGKCHE